MIRFSGSRRSRRAVYDPALPTVFMHIPKTSGSAPLEGLAGAINPRRIVSGFDRVLFGAFTAFSSIAPEIMQSVFLDGIPEGADLVAGHFAFSTLSARYRQAQYVTFLREPHSRLLSHWLYCRTRADAEMRPWGAWAKLVGLARRPLVEFLSNRAIGCQTDNLATRMLLWPHPLIPDDGFIDESADKILLKDAMARLERFDYVDVIENGDLSANLGTWLNRPFFYAETNQTPVFAQHFGPR